jgi:tetratricopeptide (TPR) repeat protein
MIRGLAVLAVVMNIATMIAWIMMSPPATYERLADRDLRAAHAAWRKSGPERAYAMYRQVATAYSRSSFSAEARFFAARTALIGLGRFQEAEAELAAFLATNPKNQEQRAEAEEHLALIRDRGDIPEEKRDEALWEYLQAMTEIGNGRFKQASIRLEKLTTAYKTTALGLKAASLKDDAEARLREIEAR